MIEQLPESSQSHFYVMSRFYVVLFLAFSLAFLAKGQDNNAVPERTPEQEAAKQTEKLKQDLRLSAEQVALAHEINLKYARARQVSNTRAEAVQRMKDKEADLMKILNYEQRVLLQNKRYERSYFRPSPSALRQQPTDEKPQNSSNPRAGNQNDNNQLKDNQPVNRPDKGNKTGDQSQQTESRKSVRQSNPSTTSGGRR